MNGWMDRRVDGWMDGCVKQEESGHLPHRAVALGPGLL